VTTSNYLLLDTNIVSYIMKGTPEAERYKPYLQGKTLAISFITVGELWAGATYQGWGLEKRKQLESTLRNFVVIPYDFEIAKCYGEIVAQRKKRVDLYLLRMPGSPPAQCGIKYLWLAIISEILKLYPIWC